MSAFLGLLITPLLAWTFAMDDVGRVSIYHLICNLVVMVFTLGLDQYYMREYYKAEKVSLMITCIMPGIISLCIFSYLFYAYRVSILQYLFETNNDAIAIIIISSFIVTLINRYLSLNLRMEGKALKFSFLMLYGSVLVTKLPWKT
jgi:O-antigen/teichoic acid export membrane protein